MIEKRKKRDFLDERMRKRDVNCIFSQENLDLLFDSIHNSTNLHDLFDMISDCLESSKCVIKYEHFHYVLSILQIKEFANHIDELLNIICIVTTYRKSKFLALYTDEFIPIIMNFVPNSLTFSIFGNLVSISKRFAQKLGDFGINNVILENIQINSDVTTEVFHLVRKLLEAQYDCSFAFDTIIGFCIDANNNKINDGLRTLRKYVKTHKSRFLELFHTPLFGYLFDLCYTNSKYLKRYLDFLSEMVCEIEEFGLMLMKSEIFVTMLSIEQYEEHYVLYNEIAENNKNKDYMVEIGIVDICLKELHNGRNFNVNQQVVVLISQLIDSTDDGLLYDILSHGFVEMATSIFSSLDNHNQQIMVEAFEDIERRGEIQNNNHFIESILCNDNLIQELIMLSENPDAEEALVYECKALISRALYNK